MLEISNSTQDITSDRNTLLQKTLRPYTLPYSISQEYPLVLSERSYNYSYCGKMQHVVATHVNLYPKKVCTNHGKDYTIGLIGNVATSPDFQGQGLMKQTIGFIEKKAVEMELDAVLLWSDLDDFYTKLGYSKVGKEIRTFLSPNRLASADEDKELKIETLNVKNVSDEMLGNFLSVRPRTNIGVARTTEEFRALLSIPETYLIYTHKSGTVTSYAIIGKGADFNGVIHEWGAVNSLALMRVLKHIQIVTEIDGLIVLSPEHTPFEKELSGVASKQEESFMAYGKKLSPQSNIPLDEMFIWGLDSI